MSDWKSAQPSICSTLRAGAASTSGIPAASAETRAQTRAEAWSAVVCVGRAWRMPSSARSRMASSSCLLRFMMSLHVLANLTAQARACAVQRDGDDHLRGAEHLGDLLVVVALEVAQREDGGGALAEACDRLPDERA